MIVRIGPILLLALPACMNNLGGLDDGSADRGSPDATIQDSSTDAGSIPGVFSDGGPEPDAQSFSPDPEDLSLAGCYNGLDDDNNRLVDCADDACGASRYCCVGSASADCCVVPGARLDIDFRTCAGTDPSTCTPTALDAFGTPRSTLEGARFIPNGDSIDDSGIVLAEALDPTRERIRLQARVAAPLDGCRDCLDVVALGLADRPSAGDVRVVPDIALLVRASRGDYAVVVAGDVVWSTSLRDGEPHDYVLEVSPDGAATLQVDGVLAAEIDIIVRPDRAALLYGRTHNRDGRTDSARVSSVHVSSSGCDMPSAMGRASAAVIPFAGLDWGSRVPTDPSVVRDGDELLVAFALDRDIHLARRSVDGTWRLGSTGQLTAPVLVAETGERLRDPELVREADRYVLYLTRQLTGGAPTIVRADGEAGHAERFGALTPIELPRGALKTESPTVVDFGGRRLMAVRTVSGADNVIALLEATDVTNSTFRWASGSLEASVVVTEDDDFERFDYDEVGDPDLTLDNEGLVRLFYAGRRGTRWSIGMRVSGDGATWREPVDGPVLSGSAGGYDSLWTRHPSASFSAAGMELFYTASNGVTMNIGRATGSAR